MHLIGKVLKESKKEIIINSQNLLLRAGYFIINDNIISLPLANILINNLKDQFLQLINSSQEIDMNMPVKELIKNNLFSEFIKAEFNSYKSLPNSFYYTNKELNKNYNTSKGLISAKNEKILHVLRLSDKHEQIEISEHMLINYNIKIMRAVQNNTEQIYTPFALGSDKYIICDACDYNSRKEYAVFDKKIKKEEEIGIMERVHTPDCTTIEEVANYLDVPTSMTAKAVFYTTDGKLIFAVIRGDLEINETLLMQTLGIDKLEAATEEQILKIGAIPGYASPVNIVEEECIVIIDDSISQSSNLVAGANKKEYHLKNVNFDRDFNCDYIANIAVASDGKICICGGELREIAGVPLINIDIIENNKYRYINNNGKPQQLIVSVISFNLYKIIAMIAENNHDENGLIIPKNVAPYDGIIISLLNSNTGIVEKVKNIISNTNKKFILDNRKIKPGIKFIEADLRGYPIRLVISDKLISNNEIELKFRDGDKSIFKISELQEFLK